MAAPVDFREETTGAFSFFNRRKSAMDEQVKEGETPETQAPEQPVTSETPETIDPAEFKRLQTALKAANREAAERRKILEAYEKAEADRQKAEMTEADRLKAELAEKDKKIAEFERATLLQKVAAEASLPPEWAARLKGESEADLKADAAELAKLIKPKNPALAPTNPAGAGKQETDAERKRRLGIGS